VAAAEQQEEGVVALFGRGGSRLGVRRLLATLAGGLAAAGVDEPPDRDRRQPRARVARRVLGPHPQRLQQRLLQRVLGGIEALAPPEQAREHRGTRARIAPSSIRRVGSSITPVSRPTAPRHDLPDVDPLVQRFPARPGSEET